MSGWTETSCRVVDVSQDLIDWFRELPGLEGDRDLTSRRSKQRVTALQSKLRRGHLMTPHWAVCLCKADGTRYRVNGQASALVLSEANGFLPDGMRVTIHELEADAYDDVVDAFTNFDSPISSRHPTEQARPILKSRKTLADIPPSYALKAIRGIVFWENGGQGRRLSDDERNRMLTDNERFIAWAAPLIRDQKIGNFVAIVAAMYATWQASPRQAGTFWGHVANEDAPTTDCPTRTLAEFLKRRLQDPMEKKRWTPLAVMVKCLHAWNAWVQGRTTNLSYFANAKGLPAVYVQRGGKAVRSDVTPVRPID